MDDLERELRTVLADDRRALPSSLVPLERVHARAARRRRRRAAAAGTAAAVAVLAVAGSAVALAGRTGDRTVPAPTSTRPGTVAAGPAWGAARVTSVTATSTRRLVVLGALGDTGACRPPDCLRLAESVDGGATFRPLAVPATATAPGPVGAATSATDVRFGSAQDGWLFGGGLWSTHDGGRTWRALQPAGRVSRLEAAAGSVWALVADTGDPTTQHLYRSPVGADSFARVASVVVTGPGDLAVRGHRVVVVGADRSRLWVGGADGFTAHGSPCAGALQVQLSVVARGLWAKCVTGTLATLATSADGVRWSAVHLQGRAAVPNSAALGARTATEALVGQGVDPPLARVASDGAVVPLPSGPAAGGQASYVGFTTPRVGYAVVGTALWRTDDGGGTWRRLTVG